MHDFDVTRYSALLNTSRLGRKLLAFPELESTNTWLKAAPSGSLEDGMVCLTDWQTKGRGQYARTWLTEPCSNLTWSYLLRPQEHDRLFLLTLACINAVANVVHREFGLSAHIKWPNDLMIEGKKVAGVLAETVFSGNHFDRFIVGIGLNVNQSSFPGTLTEASSLKQLLGRELVREKLLADIVNETETSMTAWAHKDSGLVKQINERIIGYGTKVRVEVDGKTIDGSRLLLGVNVDGHLHVMDDNFMVQTFSYEQVRIFADSL